MEEIDIVEISKNILERLITIGYEKNSLVSSGQLIFPTKSNDKRISEQELRQLFIEEFKMLHNEFDRVLYYSIETPTTGKYSFTNDSKKLKVGDNLNTGQSALIDLCVFKHEKENYKRILNIEFKHKNATHNNISKDILKLMHEEQNGAFILLLKNTDNGTLKSVFKKLSNSFVEHKANWKLDKNIQLVILSLEEKREESEVGTPFLMYRKIIKSDLRDLNKVFLLKTDSKESVTTVCEKNDWTVKYKFKI